MWFVVAISTIDANAGRTSHMKKWLALGSTSSMTGFLAWTMTPETSGSAERRVAGPPVSRPLSRSEGGNLLAAGTAFRTLQAANAQRKAKTMKPPTQRADWD